MKKPHSPPFNSHRNLNRDAEKHARTHSHVSGQVDLAQHAESFTDPPDLTVSVNVSGPIADALLNRGVSNSGCSSDVHATVLHAPQVRGYTLHIVRRVYGVQNKMMDLQASRLYIDITLVSFGSFRKDLKPDVRASLRLPDTFIKLLGESSQFVIILNSHPLYVSGVFYHGRLHRTRKPRVSLQRTVFETKGLLPKGSPVT